MNKIAVFFLAIFVSIAWAQSAPVVTNIYPSNDHYYRGETVQVFCETHDDDGDPLSVEMDYKKAADADFQPCAPNDGGDGIFFCTIDSTYDDDQLGPWDFRCRAYDGQDWSDYAHLDGSMTVINNPPSFTGLPDQITFEDAPAGSVQMDLWPYAQDTEDGADQFIYTVIGQTHPELISCFVQDNRFLTCDAPAADRTGDTEITVEATDSENDSAQDAFKLVLTPLRDLYLSGVTATPASYSAYITWQSSRPADSTVRYGPGLEFDEYQAVDFYSNWSGQQGDGNVFYELTRDGTNYEPMEFDASTDTWFDPQDAQTQFQRLPAPNDGTISWAPGHSGGTALPHPALTWYPQKEGFATLKGTVSCRGDPFCNQGDGVLLKTTINGRVRSTVSVTGDAPISIDEPVGYVVEGDEVRIEVDAKLDSYYDWGNFTNLSVFMSHPYPYTAYNASNSSTEHAVLISQLAANTRYGFRVSSCWLDECTDSSDVSFMTRPRPGGGSPLLAPMLKTKIEAVNAQSPQTD